MHLNPMKVPSNSSVSAFLCVITAIVPVLVFLLLVVIAVVVVLLDCTITFHSVQSPCNRVANPGISAAFCYDKNGLCIAGESLSLFLQSLSLYIYTILYYTILYYTILYYTIHNHLQFIVLNFAFVVVVRLSSLCTLYVFYILSLFINLSVYCMHDTLFWAWVRLLLYTCEKGVLGITLQPYATNSHVAHLLSCLFCFLWV